MPTDPIDILDMSGVFAEFGVGDTSGHLHKMHVHLAPLDPTSLAWTDAGLAADWTNLQTWAAAWMTTVAFLYPNTYTVTFSQAFPIVSGAPGPTPLAVPAITAVAGSGGSSSSPAAQLTFNFRDDATNAARFTFLGIDTAHWTPGARTLVATPAAGPYPSGLAIVCGFVTGGPVASGAKATSPLRSHAGGKILSPAYVTSTLNKRLRRRYGLS